MGVYRKAIITQAGKEVFARASAGEARIQFSRAVTSDHVYPEGTELSGITELDGIKQTVIPSDVSVSNETLICVQAMFGNENVLRTYLIQNVGLYITDGTTEVLAVIVQATEPDQMVSYNGLAPSSFIYNIQLAVSNAASIAVTINPAGIVTVAKFEEIKEKVENNTERIERLYEGLDATLTAAGWSGSGPYTQTVGVDGILATDMPFIECVSDVETKAQKRNLQKAWNMVDRIVTGDGTITATCNFERPAVDLPLRIKGA